ncbi:MAG: M28 family peptidase [Acidobacteriota bacterium]|nr:M28 family peptidase [Acidobacteriota bacterium]
MKARWLLGLVLVIGVFVVAQDHTPAPGNETISASDLEADLRFLAGDEMAGRLTDTRGNRLAAEFIRSRFARLGLTAVGTDGSYFHHFRLVTTELGENNEFTIDGGRRSEMELGDSFYPDPSSGSGHATGPLVFVGFGIDAPSLEHDDYRTAQLDGAIALMLNHEPGEHRADSVFDGTVLSEEARIVRKVLAAQARGATAVLVAPDARNHGNSQGLTRSMREIWPTRPPRVARYNLASWVVAVQIPVLHISARLADRLAREAGERFDELAERAERAGGAPAISLTGPRIEITTTVARHVIENRNVVGLIEGSDPHRRNEWIIISAHYDHDGAQGPQIFNGADDDASGVAALIEIAEAYAVAATEGQRPARSILLAAWNSEEQGLLGAWAYVRSPLHPLDDTVAVLNMDMIGRDEEIPSGGGIRFRGLEPQTAETNRNAVNILGYSRSPDLRRAATQANTSTALELRFRYDNNASNLLRRSDQWPFLYREVPAIFIHTGLHPDYHTERDRADKIRYPKMTRIVKLVHQLSWELAQDPRRPSYVQP